MSIDNPETLDELCDYIGKYKEQIFVRDQKNGKWGSFALTDLSVDKAIDHVLRFIKEQRVPYRVL